MNAVSTAAIGVVEPEAQARAGRSAETAVRIGAVEAAPFAVARVEVPAGSLPRVLTARTEDGRALSATLARLRLVRGDAAIGLGGWVGCEGRWVVDGPGAERQPALAAANGEQWAVVVNVEAGGVTGLLSIDELPDLRVQVLTLAEVARGEAVLAAAAEQAARGVDAAALGAMLNPAAGWPSERWRVMMIMRAVDPLWMPGGSGPASGPGVLRREGGKDPVLEALAAQTQAEWAHAIGRLAAVDEALAARLARTLLGLVRFDVDGRAVHAPVWPTTQDEAALRAALLNPGAGGPALVSAASAWLEARVRDAVAWVIDDAGRMGPERSQSVARIGVANLRDRAVIAWASTAADDPLPEDLEALPGHSARTEELTLSVIENVRQQTLVGAGPPLMRTVAMHIGGAVVPQRVASSPRVVLPPGLTIGPLLADWTMASWMSGAATPPVPTDVEGVAVPPADAWATAARVSRIADADGERALGTGWAVMVQANVWAADAPGAGSSAAPSLSSDSIDLWFGVTGKPSAVVRVLSDGRTQVIAGTADVPERLMVRWSEGRGSVRSWRVSVPIPASAIERGERLRVALVRVDARGVRSTWPRAMMPWQSEPGRALLDLGGWDAGVEVGP